MSAPGPDAAEGARPLLEVNDLAVRFPVHRSLTDALARRPARAVRAVDGVSFTIAPGEMLALVGESGCGKTTTAQSALRLLEPDAGTIRFEGRDITHLKARELRGLRRRAQLIYQDPYEALDPRFRVRATVEEPLLVHRTTPSGQDRLRKVLDALERAGLTPAEAFLDRYPHELSGGQRQRVAIAAALICEPRLIVADEPVSMLDVSVRAGILALLDRLRRDGLGVLMITHDLAAAVRFADRIAVMYLGRIVEEGPAARVAADPRHPYTKALISVVPDPDPRRHAEPQILTGEAPDAVRTPPGCRFHPRCPSATERCTHSDPRELWEVGGGQRAACWLVGAATGEAPDA